MGLLGPVEVVGVEHVEDACCSDCTDDSGEDEHGGDEGGRESDEGSGEKSDDSVADASNDAEDEHGEVDSAGLEGVAEVRHSSSIRVPHWVSTPARKKFCPVPKLPQERDKTFTQGLFREVVGEESGCGYFPADSGCEQPGSVQQGEEGWGLFLRGKGIRS